MLFYAIAILKFMLFYALALSFPGMLREDY